MMKYFSFLLVISSFSLYADRDQPGIPDYLENARLASPLHHIDEGAYNNPRPSYGYSNQNYGYVNQPYYGNGYYNSPYYNQNYGYVNQPFYQNPQINIGRGFGLGTKYTPVKPYGNTFDNKPYIDREEYQEDTGGHIDVE